MVEIVQPSHRPKPLENRTDVYLVGSQVLSVTRKTIHFANQINPHGPSLELKDLESQLGRASSLLGIIQLPKIARSAARTVSELKTARNSREYVQLITKVQRNGTKVVSSTISTIVFITGSSYLKAIFPPLNWFSAFGRLQEAGEDWKASRIPVSKLEKAPIEVKKGVEYAQQISFLKVLQGVLAAICALSSLMLVALGWPLISIIALSALTLMSSLIAIGTHMRMEKRLINTLHLTF